MGCRFSNAYGVIEKGDGKIRTYFCPGLWPVRIRAGHRFLIRKIASSSEQTPEKQKVLASCGQPCVGMHIRIVDEHHNNVKPLKVGEIVLQCKAVMVEDWHRPEETREIISNGWLHTGDTGYYIHTMTSKAISILWIEKRR